MPSHHIHKKLSMSQAVHRLEFSLSSDCNIYLVVRFQLGKCTRVVKINLCFSAPHRQKDIQEEEQEQK
jgi:hypothetical protein